MKIFPKVTLDITYYDYLNQEVKEEVHLENGKIHKQDFPAIIQYFINGKVRKEEFFSRGNLERNLGEPASLVYYENEELLSISFYKNGKLHREGDLPARIHFFPRYSKGQDRIASCEEYFLNGKKHRKGDKPARIQYLMKNGIISVFSVEFCVFGKTHREGDKPSYISYHDMKDENLPIPYCEEYSINGKRYKRVFYDEEGEIIN